LVELLDEFFILASLYFIVTDLRLLKLNFGDKVEIPPKLGRTPGIASLITTRKRLEKTPISNYTNS
jgi:hypothetical protein